MTIEQILILAADPSARKHKGSPTSVEAHERVKHSKEQTYKRIMDALKTKGNLTSKEIAKEMNKPLHTISGRLSELRAMDWIRKTGETRNGAAVLSLR